jgi:hypothetical protein
MNQTRGAIEHKTQGFGDTSRAKTPSLGNIRLCFDASTGLLGCLLPGGENWRGIPPVLHVWERIDVLSIFLDCKMEVSTGASA